METGEFGVWKKQDIGTEKVCADLAKEVGVPVPEFRLGTLEGQSGIIIGVSIAHGKEGLDVALLRSQNPQLFQAQSVQDAIRRASGLLPFYTWVKGTDLKEDHLVIRDDGTGGFVVAGVDFVSYMQWASAGEVVTWPGGTEPASLISSHDRGIIDTTTTAIENCSDDTIQAIVEAIPNGVFSTPEKTRRAEGLKARRSGMRQAMLQKGWI